jgi:hypothetical protein
MTTEQQVVNPHSFFNDRQSFTAPLSDDVELTLGLAGKVVELDLNQSVRVIMGPLVFGQWHYLLITNTNTNFTGNLSFVPSPTRPTNIMLNDGDQFFVECTQVKTVSAPIAGSCYWCFCDGRSWFVRGPGRVNDLVTLSDSATLRIQDSTLIHSLSVTSGLPVLTLPAATVGVQFLIQVAAVGSATQMTLASNGTNPLRVITVSGAATSTSATISIRPGVVIRCFSDGTNWFAYGVTVPSS